MKNCHTIHKLLFALFTLMFGFLSFADQGDTTVVQTFTFGSPQNAKFVFPPDYKQYEKVLMYYTLKCNPNQNPACGEWDYTTHTYLYNYTNDYDSTQMYQPTYIANGSSPDTFMYMNSPSMEYFAWWEEFINYSTTISFDSGIIGAGSISSNVPFASSESDSKTQYLWTAAEMIGAGLTAGDISGMRFYLSSLGSPLNKMTIKLKHSVKNALNPSDYELAGFTEVYSRNTSFVATGWQSINFTYPFVWNGISNIVVEICYDNNGTGIDNLVLSENTGFNSGVYSSSTDYYLNFNGPDFVDIPANVFSTIDSFITISFWQFGDPAIQPQSDYVFEAYDSDENRVLNSHLPWGNSRVYWDAGNDGASFDRIDKQANGSEYMGQWNHWAFTKDIISGQMRIYLNGALFNLGAAKTKEMAGIVKFKIGSNGSGTNSYDGFIDEFRVWDVALSQNTIINYMYKDVDVNHPNYANLQAYYQFNEGNGITTGDASIFSNTGILFGLPGWGNHNGCGLMRNFQVSNIRPNVIFEQGTYISTVDSVLIEDSLEQDPVALVLYSDSLNPTLATDTLYVWNAYYNNYIYGLNGNAIDSVPVIPDNTLYLKQMEYYDVFEITERYELGRFITPYGNGLDLGSGWTWIYDVSDYQTLLYDTVHLSAGNWQEYLDLKFLMIEGVPPRNVLNVENLWKGNFYLNIIDSTVSDWTVLLDPNASMYKLKTRTSGHHFDNSTNCAEFCYKIHNVDVNTSMIYSWEIMQQCGMNPLYPQGGTWVYDRAGWCPGMKVTTQDVELTPYVTPGDSVTIDYDSQTDPFGYYILRTHLVSYGSPNFNLDAAVAEIVSPNNWEIQNRFNPICDNPVVIIQNTGITNLTSLDIEFGIKGGDRQIFNWSGNLAFLEKEQVTLTSSNNCWYIDENAESNVFEVIVRNPNGGQDEYSANNTAKTNFDIPPQLGNHLYLLWRTNLIANETSYKLVNENGAIVYQSGILNANTVYRDTFNLAPGCYRLYLDDSDCDGLSWWANNDGNGYASLYNADGTNSLLKSFEADFGCQISYSFTVGLPIFTVSTTNSSCGGLDGTATLNFSDPSSIYTYQWSNGSSSPTINGLDAGIYGVTVTSSNNCSDEKTFVINDVGAASLSVSTSDMSCNGICDGTSTISATGGTAPYIYLWDDPSAQTSAIATGLCARAFTVSVLDNAGCISFSNNTILEPDSISLEVYVNDVEIACDGSARADLTGGTSPYSYSWDDPGAQTTFIASGLCDGIYNVTVSDAKGCTVSKAVVVLKGAIDVDPDLNIKVYPIPSKDIFNVVLILNAMAPVEFMVYNILGQVIFKENIGFQAGFVSRTVDLSFAQPGVYFMRIGAGESFVVKKIIKH